ncbi:hypothetical protein ARALYDRAFT_891439 [Arabidopsis lyrata subsp. lyrata]|uniref:Thioredoxin domain-containing protein n=1 Tax=Arabidopsis lyrata subsp. lyrata TaxID=81972 RepID=D7KPS5_ARALL|nr:hypothetical protein ARALYDRAFT_891439 [Arabidopsis lyrata subsp. lyrata]
MAGEVIPYRCYLDELLYVAKEFKVEAMPTFVFMKEGEILDHIIGAEREKIQEKLLKHGGFVLSTEYVFSYCLTMNVIQSRD